MRMAMLGDARKRVEAEFAQKLTALPPFRHNKTEFKVSREQAERDIKIVTQEMETQIDNFFAAKVNAHIFSMTYRSTGVVVAESEAEKLVDDPRVKAMLDTLAFAEGTGKEYGKIVEGLVVKSPFYTDLVGKKNVIVTDFSKHPEILVKLSSTLSSTAAGRYQFKIDTWKSLKMPDFSPRSQDIAAVKLMKQRKMIAFLLAGKIKDAIINGSGEWASFPDANGKSQYGQPVKSFQELQQVYNQALESYQSK